MVQGETDNENQKRFCESEGTELSDDIVWTYVDRKSEESVQRYIDINSQRSDGYWDENVASAKEFRKKFLVALETRDEDFIDEMRENEYIEEYYDVPAERCPICCMKEVTDDDARNYMLKKYDITFENMKADIKKTFGDYKSFKDYIAPPEDK